MGVMIIIIDTCVYENVKIKKKRERSKIMEKIKRTVNMFHQCNTNIVRLLRKLSEL